MGNFAKDHWQDAVSIGAAITVTAVMCGATAGVGCIVAAGAIAGGATNAGFASFTQIRAGTFNPIKIAKAGAGGAIEGATGALAGHGIGRIGGKLLNRLAAKAWAGGAKVMNEHFVSHGASLGYKTAWGYTAGAILNITKTMGRGVALISNARAYISGNKAALTYGGKLVTFFKSKNIFSWLANKRR